MRTHSYPPSKHTAPSYQAPVTRVFAWVRRRPAAALGAALTLFAFAAIVDAVQGPGSHLGFLYLLPITLAGASLSRGTPFVFVTICVASHLAVSARWSGIGPGFWPSHLSFLTSSLFVAGVTSALRASVGRELRHVRVLEGLKTVSAAVSSSLDLQQVLNTALAQAQRLTHADPIGIWLCDREHSELVLGASVQRLASRRVRPDSVYVSLDSEHLIARCIERGSVLVSETQVCDGPKAASCLCVRGVSRVAAIPLVVHGSTLGVLAAGLGADEQETIDILSDIANDAAIAIDNAMLYAEARRHVASLEVLRAQAERDGTQARFLADAGRLFAATLDLRATLDAAAARAAESFGDTCVIALAQPETGCLSVAAACESGAAIGRSLRDYLVSHPPSQGDGLLCQVALDGRPRLARGDAANPGELGELAREVGLRAALVVPLKRRGRVIGILACGYYDVQPRPTEEDLQLLILFAERAAMALENAELFQETQQARVALESWSHELELRVAQKTHELQEAHQELLHAERLASIGKLAETIAHELRNPLNVIKVAGIALAKTETAVQRTRYVDAIGRQVLAASRIITALVDFAQDAPPSLLPTDLNALIRQVLADAPIPTHVSAGAEPEPALPPVQADPVQVAQVLRNLVDNAVQAMPSGGSLVLRTFRRGARACVSVQDTGPGIPEEVRPHLFEPLFTTRTKGPGLGLAIARRIMDAHGGQIQVESAPGAGATFTICFPLPEAGLDAPAANPSL